jgi:hypothetical protein
MDTRAALEYIAKYYYNFMRPSVTAPDKDPQFPQVTNIINLLRQEGFTGREICERISSLKETKSYPPIEKIFTNEERNYKKYSKNLIDKDKAYVHPDLKILPKPPVIDFDYATGKVTETYDDTEPRLKDSYTIDDLLSYFYQKCNVTRTDVDRDRGAMFYVLSRAGSVDIVLCTIEYILNCNIIIHEVIRLNDHLAEGYAYWQTLSAYYTEIAYERGGLSWFQVDG